MGMYIQDDYWEAAQALTPRQRAEFFDSIISYHFTGVEPKLTGAVAACFALCRERIDRAKQLSEKNAENGRKGGIAKAANAKRNAGEQPSETLESGKRTASETASESLAKEKRNHSAPIKERERELDGEQDANASCENVPSDEGTCRAGARRDRGADAVEEVVGYLNAKTGKAFKATSSETKRLVNARMADGFTVDDFKRVIDVKVAEWAGVTSGDGRRMDDYLRPSTLFRAQNFEGYLNSGVSVPKPGAPPGRSLTGDAAGDEALRERLGLS